MRTEYIRKRIRHQEILTTAQMYETIVFAPLSSAAIMNSELAATSEKSTVYGFCVCQVVIFSVLMQCNYFDYLLILIQYIELEKIEKSGKKIHLKLLLSTIPCYLIIAFCLIISPLFLLADIRNINLSTALVATILGNIIGLCISSCICMYLYQLGYYKLEHMES